MLSPSSRHRRPRAGTTGWAARRLAVFAVVAIFAVASMITADGSPRTKLLRMDTGVVHINAGGAAFTTPGGSRWQADQGGEGGVSTRHRVVTEHGVHRIYRTANMGMSRYELKVPNGTYRVQLKMMETHWRAPGRRVQSASVEGKPIFTNLDLYADAGRFKAIRRVATVQVKDGTLSIRFSASAGRTTVSGIDVFAANDPAPSAAPDQPGTGADQPGSNDRLTWKPPTLNSPTTINYSATATSLNLDDRKDYIIKLPTDGPLKNPNGLVIVGGHNVVLIGGSISVGAGVKTSSGEGRRGAYFKNQTGTMYVEGLRLLSPPNQPLYEGINLSQDAGATVVIQNTVVEKVVGSYDGWHADGIQTWAGPDKLLVDRVTITTGYQGMFLTPGQLGKKRPELFDLRHIDIHGTSESAYLLWRDSDVPTRVQDVAVRSDSRTSRDQLMWPKGDPTWASVSVGQAAEEYGASAGVGYKSPGYIS